MHPYTSLRHFKMVMANGQRPPMTPVPEKHWGLINPSFTIGMGALNEDYERGLQCPVRGCGGYYHILTLHLNASHRNVGGAATVKRALSIPPTAKLISVKLRDRLSAASKTLTVRKEAYRERVRKGEQDGPWKTQSPGIQAKRIASRAASFESVGMKNERLQCEKQMRMILLDCQVALGRSPSIGDARSYPPMGYKFVREALRTYGSWNSFKAQMGLECNKPGGTLPGVRKRRPMDVSAVVEALAAWYNVHGTLPNWRTAANPNRLPLIPHAGTILHAFKTTRWGRAMEGAASLLNIYGGKYGLPIEHKPKEVAA